MAPTTISTTAQGIILRISITDDRVPAVWDALSATESYEVDTDEGLVEEFDVHDEEGLEEVLRVLVPPTRVADVRDAVLEAADLELAHTVTL